MLAAIMRPARGPGDRRMFNLDPFAGNTPLEFIWALFILILGISILFS